MQVAAFQGTVQYLAVTIDPRTSMEINTYRIPTCDDPVQSVAFEGGQITSDTRLNIAMHKHSTHPSDPYGELELLLLHMTD